MAATITGIVLPFSPLQGTADKQDPTADAGIKEATISIPLDRVDIGSSIAGLAGLNASDPSATLGLGQPRSSGGVNNGNPRTQLEGGQLDRTNMSDFRAADVQLLFDIADSYRLTQRRAGQSAVLPGTRLSQLRSVIARHTGLQGTEKRKLMNLIESLRSDFNQHHRNQPGFTYSRDSVRQLLGL